MNFLARDTVSFSDDFWANIDNTVVNTVRTHIIGRRFLSLYGPLGAGVRSINIDSVNTAEEAENGFVKTTGRKLLNFPKFMKTLPLTGEISNTVIPQAFLWICQR
nr:family 1 encapsulin nanocompartment shell protein [Thermoclostridium stercorarium]